MKKILIALTLIGASFSAPAFSYTNHAYGELGLGGAWVSVGDKHTNIESDSVFQVKAGLGYRQNFSKCTPFFWGVDSHYNYYDFEKSNNTVDAALMLGGDLSSCFGAYAKIGAEYFFDEGDVKPKLGIGIDYRFNPQLTLAAEVNSTLMSHDNDVISSLSSGTLSLQIAL